jgi:DNA-binding transcriptional LysR family regulator
MQFDHLIYFVEVVKAKSISAAAKNLHISQPALSKTIKTLEDELGQKVLKRTRQGVYPTPIGQKIFSDFQVILDIMNSWYAKDIFVEPEGQINISSVSSASKYILNEIILPFSQRYPKVEVNLHGIRVQTAIPTVKNTPTNIAITTVPPLKDKEFIQQAEELGLKIHYLFTDERRILIGATHPLAQKEALSQEDLKTLSIAYYAGNDIIAKVYEPYFASAYKIANRENAMELVINNAAVFLHAYYLMKRDYYIANSSVKSFPIPITEISSNVPVIAITTDILSKSECLFRDYLIKVFADDPPNAQ